MCKGRRSHRGFVRKNLRETKVTHFHSHVSINLVEKRQPSLNEIEPEREREKEDEEWKGDKNGPKHTNKLLVFKSL